MKRMLLPSLVPLCGAAADPPAQPRLSRAEAASLLVREMVCVDRDGFTDCDPVQPRRISLRRFRCVNEPPAQWRPELARLACRVAGILTWSNGRQEALPGGRADFFLFDRNGAPVWETGGLYIARVAR